jgi:uncharacterized protein YaaN involved in tellurite resistance
MTDEKANELIKALERNSIKAGSLENTIDSLYNLLNEIKISNQFRHIDDKLDNIISTLDQ